MRDSVTNKNENIEKTFDRMHAAVGIVFECIFCSWGGTLSCGQYPFDSPTSGVKATVKADNLSHQSAFVLVHKGDGIDTQIKTSLWR